MRGGELIASFLDDDAIDEFVISVAAVCIGKGITDSAPPPSPLDLRSVERFEDGLGQLHFRVQNQHSCWRGVLLERKDARQRGRQRRQT